MSNSLAIATVTATLQRLLQRAIAEDFPKAKITIVRPEASGNNTPKIRNKSLSLSRQSQPSLAKLRLTHPPPQR